MSLKLYLDIKALSHQDAFPQRVHTVAKFLELPWDHNFFFKTISNFIWDSYKWRCNSVLKAAEVFLLGDWLRSRRVSAKLRVFILRSRRALRAHCVHKTFCTYWNVNSYSKIVHLYGKQTKNFNFTTSKCMIQSLFLFLLMK